MAVTDGAYRPAAFVDKDGTLVEDVPYNVSPQRLRLMPGVPEGLGLLSRQGFRIIVVTNQPGLARGLFDRAQLMRLHASLALLLQASGVPIDDFFVCPHAPATSRTDPGCLCRKPAPGLLRQAALLHRIDLARSWMLGDILDDVEAGHRAGCRSALIDVGNETEWRLSPSRTPDIRAGNLLEAAVAIVTMDEADRAASPASSSATSEPMERASP